MPKLGLLIIFAVCNHTNFVVKPGFLTSFKEHHIGSQQYRLKMDFTSALSLAKDAKCNDLCMYLDELQQHGKTASDHDSR